MKPGQSPGRTGQSWALPAVGRVPAARGTCPFQRERRQRISAGCHFYLFFLNLAAGPAGYSRLGGVEGVGAVPHILGAVENAESQTGKEVTRGQIASHRPDGESCAL